MSNLGISPNVDELHDCSEKSCAKQFEMRKRELNNEKSKLHSKLVGMLAMPRSSNEEFMAGMRKIKEIEDEINEINGSIN